MLVFAYLRLMYAGFSPLNANVWSCFYWGMYVEENTGKHAILSDDGEVAPYNGEPEYSINTEKAGKIGYHFSNLKEWIYQLLDYYIEKVNKGN